MDIGDLLSRATIVTRAGASSKRQVLQAVADTAAEALGLPAQHLLDALMEREALGSTGLGGGVAVPHARLAEVDRMTGVFIRFDTPVAFDAVDDRPVDLVFALFAPSSAGAEHLRALAAVSRRLRSEELRQQLRQARTLAALHAVFLREDSADAA